MELFSKETEKTALRDALTGGRTFTVTAEVTVVVLDEARARADALAGIDRMDTDEGTVARLRAVATEGELVEVVRILAEPAAVVANATGLHPRSTAVRVTAS